MRNLINIMTLIFMSSIPCISLANDDQSSTHFRLDFFATTKFINEMKLSQASEKSILMFGDSITQSLNENDMHFDYTNLGIGGDTAKGIFERMMNVDLGHYKGVFVSAGTNDLIKGEDGIILANEIEKIVDYSAPKAKHLYVSEVFVPNKSIVPQVPNNFSVINIKIREACSRYKNCTVIPTPKGMIGSDGISTKMSLIDGVHLNSTGYALWKIELNKKMADFPVNYYYHFR
ncbi:SGNH/GDSL hydrolase family protein, partial [Escherichia coli]|uniref:SGNH/GDSL hydrolase family protein n=1 Tax=Escherichia coli TaxID=562 RepID=UPI001C7E4855